MVACDKRLHRMMSYLNSTANYVQKCDVGDSTSKCHLALFTDAGFAGDLKDSRSTSGAFLFLVGPNTFVPITWFCEKQGAVSHSSTEAEVISLDAGLRMEGIPSLALWEEVVEVCNGKKSLPSFPTRGETHAGVKDSNQDIGYVPCNVPKSKGIAKLAILEDNDPIIKMREKGRSPNLRHVARTPRVDLDWIYERVRDDPSIFVKYFNTSLQIADILTKGQFTAAQWQKLWRLSQTVEPTVSVSTRSSSSSPSL